MTTFLFDAFIGTNSISRWSMTSDSFTGYALDDADDAIGMIVSLPFNGTITEIGFHVTSITGTPPTYKAGLCTVSETTGAPTQSAYGGSSIEDYTPSGAGWTWVTLSTPASGIMGEFAAIHIFPGASAPSVSNRMTVTTETFTTPLGFPNRMNFATAWNTNNPGFSYWAVKWQDGSIYGIPAISKIRKRIAGDTSPNEAGCRFTLPFGVTCVGPFVEWVGQETNVTAKINLYDSNNTILRSLYYSDLDKVAGTTTAAIDRGDLRWSSPVTLDKDATYRLTIEVLSSGAGISIPTIFVQDEATRQNCKILNFDRWYGTERTASGAWTDYTNRVSTMGIHISSIEVTTSGAGPAGGSYAYIG